MIPGQRTETVGMTHGRRRFDQYPGEAAWVPVTTRLPQRDKR